MKPLLTQDDLQEWLGYAQQSKIEQWLEQHKIPFSYGKQNKIVTTTQAVNAALMGQAANDEGGEIDFD